MTEIEVIASLLMQIKNLRARIESAGEDSLTWAEEYQLKYLENKLDQIRGGKYAHSCKLWL